MSAREQALQDIKEEQMPHEECIKLGVDDDDYVRITHLRNKDIRFGFNQFVETVDFDDDEY
jgi:hypothetical protein